MAELGILLPALIPLLFGPLAIQRMHSEYQVLAQAASEGARLAAIQGPEAAGQRIQEMLRAGGLADASWQVQGPDGWGGPVVVTVSKSHRLVLPLVSEQQLQLSASREARSERE